MTFVENISALQALSLAWKASGKIALVPTMGALHEGHLALVKRAKAEAQHVIVSIFVNPLQFGPTEDFEKYPRTLAKDCALLEGLADVVFAPTPKEMYPEGFSTSVRVGALQDHLCGKSRPAHFNGVATVCLKLFQASLPDTAIFGEKDFQQLRILEDMVRDFNLPLRILRHPTVREADGLAMSSRNRYLSALERDSASRFAVALRQTARSAQRVGSSVGDVLTVLKSSLEEIPVQVDYIEIASEKDLVPASFAKMIGEIPKARLFAAVKVGSTRLIDNQPLEGS